MGGFARSSYRVLGCIGSSRYKSCACESTPNCYPSRLLQ